MTWLGSEFEKLTGSDLGALRDNMQQGFHGGSFSSGGLASIHAFDPLISKERVGNAMNRSVGGKDIFSPHTMDRQANVANTAGKLYASYAAMNAIGGAGSSGNGTAAGGGAETGTGTVNPSDGMTTSQLPADSPPSGNVYTNPDGSAVDVPPNQAPGYTPSATTTTTTPPTTSTGWGATALKYGPLAISGINALTSRSPRPTDAQNQQSANAAAQQAQGQKLLDQYNSGQLNAADGYNVAQWEQGQTEATKQYYAKAGLADSSMAQQALAGVQQQASAMRQQVLQNYLSSGMNALGGASNALTPIISQQIAADQQAQQAQSQFLQTMALMSASS